MGLQADLEAALHQAMRASQPERVSVIRMLRAAIKNREIEKGKSHPLSESELLEVVMTASKQRRDAIDLYAKGGRQDLVEKETRELAILGEFLPAPVTAEELEAKITDAVNTTGAAGLKEMGKVMKLLMPQLIGRVDGARLSERVKARLSQ
jgi:uncharacterized protein YqeY